VLLPGCGGNSTGGNGGQQQNPPSGLIGVGGGDLTSADLKVKLVVPANAVSRDTQFTIQPANGFPPSGRIIGTVYDIEPTGTAFSPSALPVLTITYSALPAGVDPATLTIGTLDNSGQWANVQGSQVNTSANTVSVPLEHLSPYVLLKPADPTPPSGRIGPSGGSVASTDGMVTLTLPPNAVTVETQFSIAPASGYSSSSRIVGTVYAIEPTGTLFPASARPQLTIRYNVLPSGVNSATLTVGTQENGQWVDVPESSVSQTAQEVSAPLAHLSPYALLQPAGAPPPPNQNPSASAGGPYSGQVGAAITFNAAGSMDPDQGDQLTYRWDFGDNSAPVTVSTVTTTHAYASAGDFQVTLTVSDGRGGSGTAQADATITDQPPVNSPPTASAGGPYVGTVGQSIPFNAGGSFDPDDVLPSLTFVWDFGDGSSPGSGMTPMHAYTSDRTWPVKVTVSDPHGASDEAETTATISPAPPTNQPPTITGTTIPPTGLVNEVLSFSATATDPDGDALSYRWDFGDQSPFDLTASTTHSYGTVEQFTVTLTVADGRGGEDSAIGSVTISNPVLPIAFPQVFLGIPMRQPQSFVFEYKYAITLSGTGGVPPLRFKVVSLPTYQDPADSTMQLVAGSYYQWWDDVNGHLRFECQYNPPESCTASTSSHVDPTTGYVVDSITGRPIEVSPGVPPSVPPVVVFAPQKCTSTPNPLTDGFVFTVTDSEDVESDPATVTFTTIDTICKSGTH
jgi:PKD repeat protein